MSNLDSFTNDEQLIITHSMSTNTLLRKLAELTDTDLDELTYRFCAGMGDFISTVTVDELRVHLEGTRTEHTLGRELARKHYNDQKN